MPIENIAINLIIPFSSKLAQATRETFVIRHDPNVGVGDITPNALMVPKSLSGSHFQPPSTEQVVWLNRERFTQKGDRIYVEPAMDWGEQLSYTIPFGAQFDNSGKFFWPFKRPTRQISIRIEKIDGVWPNFWQAVLQGKAIPVTSDESGIGIEAADYNGGLMGQQLVVAWSNQPL